MYDRVLLPTDGSAGMDRVVEHASAIAEMHGATLQALYVIDTGALSDVPIEGNQDALARGLREEGQTALAEVETLAGDVPVETDVVEGTPAKTIVEYAVETDCDLIVMGTHGRSGVDRILLGSVAERVVRQSAVPVMTVRVGDPGTGTGD